MRRVKKMITKAFTPITVMFIPHTSKRTYSIKIPSIGIFVSFFIFLTIAGFAALYFTAATVPEEKFSAMEEEFSKIREKLSFYSEEFISMKDTIDSLKNSEVELKKLLSYETKEQIYEHVDTLDTGSVDIELLKGQIQKTMERVSDIKDYIQQQKDVYFSTPKGWPVGDGYISSAFGYRTHPKKKKREFHGGIDIASRSKAPVKATADGIVSFAGWSGGSGKLIVIEHGSGYTTCYGHNRKIMVKVGQKVKRGEAIALVGSTGNSTGPHVHYEIWIDGKRVNPRKYL